MKSNIEIFLSRPMWILKILSIWLRLEKPVFLYYTTQAVVLFTQYSFLIFEFMYIVFVWGDIDEVSEASYLFFTQASVCYKVAVFVLHKKNLKSLLDFMMVDTFAPQSTVHSECVKQLTYLFYKNLS